MSSRVLRKRNAMQTMANVDKYMEEGEFWAAKSCKLRVVENRKTINFCQPQGEDQSAPFCLVKVAKDFFGHGEQNALVFGFETQPQGHKDHLQVWSQILENDISLNSLQFFSRMNAGKSFFITPNNLICPVRVTDLTPRQFREFEDHAFYLSTTERDKVLQTLAGAPTMDAINAGRSQSENPPLRLLPDIDDEESRGPDDAAVPSVSALCQIGIVLFGDVGVVGTH